MSMQSPAQRKVSWYLIVFAFGTLFLALTGVVALIKFGEGNRPNSEGTSTMMLILAVMAQLVAVFLARRNLSPRADLGEEPRWPEPQTFMTSTLVSLAVLELGVLFGFVASLMGGPFAAMAGLAAFGWLVILVVFLPLGTSYWKRVEELTR